MHDSTRVAKDVAYESLWQANDITRDDLKSSVVKEEEAERVSRRYYYEIVVLHSQHAAILKYEQYKMAARSLAQPDCFRQEGKGLV